MTRQNNSDDGMFDSSLTPTETVTATSDEDKSMDETFEISNATITSNMDVDRDNDEEIEELDDENIVNLDDDEDIELDQTEFEAIDNIAGSLPEDSVVSNYLEGIYNRLKGGNEPAEYQKKTFWVHHESPSFAISKKTKPDSLYIPRVFIWLPHYIKKDLKCPTCSSKLEIKGYNTEPRARRVIDLHE